MSDNIELFYVDVAIFRLYIVLKSYSAQDENCFAFYLNTLSKCIIYNCIYLCFELHVCIAANDENIISMHLKSKCTKVKEMPQCF